MLANRSIFYHSSSKNPSTLIGLVLDTFSLNHGGCDCPGLHIHHRRMGRSHLPAKDVDWSGRRDVSSRRTGMYSRRPRKGEGKYVHVTALVSAHKIEFGGGALPTGLGSKAMHDQTCTHRSPSDRSNPQIYQFSP
uniref:Uncharacterized protein n=1 Tax=Molossus molossus TaxID=27622 RepID=A0A7J8I8R6_MOLMO|nr:hypothetical protein HJG59_010519 [Molossus molossus]